jgi:predicted 3-demethylubiquinone-9 3-methyltransferase (glyoxalase superfamily)
MTTPVPCLWFDAQAEEAAQFYCSVFPDSRIHEVSRYAEHAGERAGTVLTVNFEVQGAPFMALNGGPQYTFSEAVSFFVPVDTQDEIDRLWDALTADGGEPGRCGWLKDRFGVSWQIVPANLGELIGGGSDPDGAGRAMAAMLQMSKLDIATLERARDGV